MLIRPRRPLVSRRAVLRGLLGGAAVAVGLPALECMMPERAWAGGSGFPKRFGLFFWGNGNIPDRWTPTGEGTDWELSEQLAPLADVRDVVTVVSGMSVKVPNVVPHGSGAAGLLSGAPMLSENGSETFQQPSIDQVVANAVGGETIFRSLQTAASDNDGLSYNGANSRNPPDTDPYAFYERLFGATFRAPGEEGQVDPTIGLRRSVLDAVMDDADSLRGRVGVADQARLDQHLQGIRDLESRLAKLEEDPPSLAACSRPAELTADYADVDGRPQLAARSEIMGQLLAMALACDQTRVFAHYFTQPINNWLFPEADAGHHELTHNEPGDQPEVNQITIHCVEAYAAMVQAMRAIPEGDGTLLDHMVLLGCSEVSLGRTHSLDEMPILLAGSCDGSLLTGLHYRSYTAENASMVMVSILRAMGITTAGFGVDDALATDGLSAIEA